MAVNRFMHDEPNWPWTGQLEQNGVKGTEMIGHQQNASFWQVINTVCFDSAKRGGKEPSQNGMELRSSRKIAVKSANRHTTEQAKDDPSIFSPNTGVSRIEQTAEGSKLLEENMSDFGHLINRIFLSIGIGKCGFSPGFASAANFAARSNRWLVQSHSISDYNVA
jgi:hypothetical protein